MKYKADIISLLYFGVHSKQNANARLSHELSRDDDTDQPIFEVWLMDYLKLYIIRSLNDDRLFDRKAVQKSITCMSQNSKLYPFLPFQCTVILKTFS